MDFGFATGKVFLKGSFLAKLRFEHSFNVKSMALRVDRDLTPKMSSPQVALDNRSRNIKIRRLLS